MRRIAVSLLLVGLTVGSVDAETLKCGVYETTQKCFTAPTIKDLQAIISIARRGDTESAIRFVSSGQATFTKKGADAEVVVGVEDLDKEGVTFCYLPQTQKYAWILTGHLAIFKEHPDIGECPYTKEFKNKKGSLSQAEIAADHKCKLELMRNLGRSSKIPATLKTIDRQVVVSELSRDFTMGRHLTESGDKDAIFMALSEEKIKILEPGTKLSVIKRVITEHEIWEKGKSFGVQNIEALWCCSGEETFWISSEYTEPLDKQE